ncbi:radical SAM protein [Streptomyces sp. CBMA152]|uniref:radical SAM protein n=1 Tax=Streptomyces sp. CBMA152 TaxID=1896312 RepID=UPI002948BF21|nr:radical SAM protein [Streptomyces sp. CBMA152]MBD0743821.1 radical SAM protein [Streptomyces sp. CBMA152]
MQSTASKAITTVRSIELEVTGKCQAQCEHCLADSGPTGTDGTMTLPDWLRIIDDAPEIGVKTVQLIGGDPTLYRGSPELIRRALGRGLDVEVFTNLIAVPRRLWDALALPGVGIGTSYYSDQPEQHDRITRTRNSHKRTRANIIEALQRSIPVRAGIVECFEGQRVREAEADLRALGVEQITVDRMRPVGRGARGTTPDLSDLCGRFTRGRAAVLPNGDVAGCVLSRFMPAGNVHEQSLADILSGAEWASIAARVPGLSAGACPPDDSGDCSPANTEACPPAFDSVAELPIIHIPGVAR